jgi:hypothetical protein
VHRHTVLKQTYFALKVILCFNVGAQNFYFNISDMIRYEANIKSGDPFYMSYEGH